MKFNFFWYNIGPETSFFVGFISMVIMILVIVGAWRIFEKAGEAGWKAVIPIYNFYILYKITWGSGWLFLLMLIPVVNFIVGIITSYKLAKVFGKGIGFTLGILFFPYIFQLILGFGNARYIGTSYV